MFEIQRATDGTLQLSGRLDAIQADRAREVLAGLTGDGTLDLARLDYVSSAGLGIFLATQKRLSETGHGLKFVNMNPHIRDLFRITGLDTVFTIE
jgi:anti-anti-sigma factor